MFVNSLKNILDIFVDFSKHLTVEGRRKSNMTFPPKCSKKNPPRIVQKKDFHKFCPLSYQYIILTLLCPVVEYFNSINNNYPAVTSILRLCYWLPSKPIACSVNHRGIHLTHLNIQHHKSLN